MKKFIVDYRIAFSVLCFLNSIFFFINSNGILGKIGACFIFIAGLCAIFDKQVKKQL
ncbi:hypothetical protein [Inconstantimicrobium mannanitabidum]|uniref:hypothetical protein n=1 Tax=Inconstantimicrobium mannanitabidum TaxID=1604901 RepID=UPI0021C2FD05|nr:hypothetical protein [Clostridium sp. TW13]